MGTAGQTEEWFKQADYDLGTAEAMFRSRRGTLQGGIRMATQLLVDIEQILRELCAERAIPVESVQFFGSRALGTAQERYEVKR